MVLESTQLHKVEQQKGILNLRDILTVLFKYQRFILAISFLATLASLALTFSMKPIFKAETSLLVKVGREHLFTSEATDSTPRMAIDMKTIVDPELAILASQDLRQRVLETIGVPLMYPDLLASPPENLSPMQSALLRFKENLHVSQESKSNVIRVTFQHEDSKMAAKAVNMLAKFWKEKHLKIFSTPQAPFLQEQAENYREILEHSETQLQQFKQQHGISSFLKQSELLLVQLQELDTTLKAAQNETQGLMTKIRSLAKQMKTIQKEIPLTTVNGQRHILDDTKQELLTLQRKEQELIGRYQDKSRLLVEIRREIDLIQAFIDEQEAKLGNTVTSGRNPIYQQLELELLSAKSQYAALQTRQRVITSQLKGLDDKIGHLGQLQQEFDRLSREVKKGQEDLSKYVEKVEAAKITEEMDRQQIANVSVIQTANAPIKSSKSIKTIIVIFGLIVGIFGSIILALVLEQLQGSYTRPEQVTNELGLPILVSITNKG